MKKQKSYYPVLQYWDFQEEDFKIKEEHKVYDKDKELSKLRANRKRRANKNA